MLHPILQMRNMRVVFLVLLAVVSCALAQMPPFWNVPSKQIDSTNHGVTPGNRPTTCRCGWANKQRKRIIGGKQTEVNEYPFAVLLALKQGNIHFCGGSLITSQHVLTAAHCPNAVTGRPIVVIVGEHDNMRVTDTPHTQVIDVMQSIIHENYDVEYQHNDISLLVMARPVKFTDQIGPVCMPNKPLTLDNQYLKVVGWGKTAPYGSVSSVLKEVNVRVIPLNVCRYYADIFDDGHQICTFSKMKGFGQGDSGGPVVWVDPNTNYYTLVGLPSFVYLYDSANMSPDVATDVSSFLPWINKKIRETVPSAKTCTAA